MTEQEEKAMVEGQAHVWKLILAFADSMALRCVVELGIPDIINRHGGPASLSQIAAGINSSSPDTDYLFRVMRLCVRKGVFTAASGEDTDTLYGLTHAGKWLLRDSEHSLAPLLELATNEWVMSPWRYFGKCIQEGGNAFSKAYGTTNLFDYASVQPEFNKLFNSGMACTSKVMGDALLASYKNGFQDVGLLVDIGGGTGTLIREIVKAHPHIQGINFDLPHVVATAPEVTGVQNVSGDMFVDLPPADAYILKLILHDWNDESCTRILKNCHKAMEKGKGKVIIMDLMLKPEGSGLFDEIGLVQDLTMMAVTSGGKERTEAEWKKLLEDGGFPRYKIIDCHSLPCIIEAYPA